VFTRTRVPEWRDAFAVNCTSGMRREQQRLGRSAANDADLADAAFDGALGGFQFQDHASETTWTKPGLDLFAGDGARTFSPSSTPATS